MWNELSKHTEMGLYKSGFSLFLEGVVGRRSGRSKKSPRARTDGFLDRFDYN